MPQLFTFVFFDLPADGSDKDAHQRGKQVEETIGEIGEGGDAQHRGLCHATGVPGDEHRGDGGRILCCTAQQSRLIAFLLIYLFIYISIEDDGDELVASGDVKEDASADG